MAGMNCARLLFQSGFSVTIFDKGRFPSGRLASRTRDDNCFDYGAQYFTARSKSFTEFIEPLIKSELVQLWQGKIGALGVDGSAREVDSTPRYVAVPSMRNLSQAFLSADCVQFQKLHHRVHSVQFDGASWRLEGVVDGGAETRFFDDAGYDYLVLNLPPPQGQFLFACEELARFEMEPCFALMLSFETRLKTDLDGIFFDDEILSWAARDSSKPGRPEGERWVIHSSSGWSAVNIEEDLTVVSETMIERFKTLLRLELPEITFSKCHRWRYARPGTEIEVGSIYLEENRLGFCGDWCQGSRVEGAFLSGESMAQKVLSSVGASI